MNKDNARLYLPLAQALADGRVIQRRDIAGNWCDSPDIFDGEPASRYRIKPEPREWWFCEITNNGACIGRYVFTSHGEARSFSAINGVPVVHVREVLPP